MTENLQKNDRSDTGARSSNTEAAVFKVMGTLAEARVVHLGLAPILDRIGHHYEDGERQTRE